MSDDEGELFLEIPEHILDKYDWKEDDDLMFVVQEDGSLLIKKSDAPDGQGTNI